MKNFKSKTVDELNKLKKSKYARWVGKVPLYDDGTINKHVLSNEMDTMNSGWDSDMNFILDGKWHPIVDISYSSDFNDILITFSNGSNFYWGGFIDYMEFISPRKILKDLMEWK